MFCGGRPLTNEHVWPDWIGRLFFGYEPGGRAPLSAHRVSSSVGSERNRQWTAPSFTTKAKIVCDDCNHGWMSELENAAEPILTPMLQGKRLILDDEAQTIVARWLTKTAMMFQHTTPRRPIPERHFRYLRDHLRPPPSSQVWLGARTAEDGGVISGLQSSRLRPLPEDQNGPVYNSYLVTIGIAAFIGQVFGHDIPRFDFQWGHEGRFASAVEQIWPAVEPIKWPPKHIVRSVEDFAKDPGFGRHLVRSFAGQGVEMRIVDPKE